MRHSRNLSSAFALRPRFRTFARPAVALALLIASSGFAAVCRAGDHSFAYAAVWSWPAQELHTVPVVALPGGSGPEDFQPLGFMPDGRLAFRYVLAPGGGAREWDTALFDPLAGTVTTQAAGDAKSAVTVPFGSVVQEGRPFAAAGNTFTLLRADPVDGSAPDAVRREWARELAADSTPFEEEEEYEPPHINGHALIIMSDRGGRYLIGTSPDSDLAVAFAAVAPSSPRLVLAASVKQGQAHEIAFVSVDLAGPEQEGTGSPAATCIEPSSPFVGFSRAGHVAIVDVADPKKPRVRIASLANGAVVFDGACEDSSDALSRFAVLSSPVWVMGFNWDAIPIDDAELAIRLEGRSLVVRKTDGHGIAIGEKVVARYGPKEAAAIAKALPLAQWARSPFEPRIALVIPTRPRAHLVVVHLATGFKAR